MRLADGVTLAWRSLAGNRRRTLLLVLATSIGVSAVIALGALGEGARRFVTNQFAALGTNLVIVMPGRNETIGGAPPIMGATPRDLTLGDALALGTLPGVAAVAPVMVGSAPVSTAAGLEREVTVLGSSRELASVRRLELGHGRFLPPLELTRSAAVCVLGFDLAAALFGHASAIGQSVRIGDRRMRVVGVLAEGGVSVGVDFDDLAIVPVAAAQALFDREGLFRILVEARETADLERLDAAIHRLIAARHEGEDDVTVITQDSVVATLGKILDAVTFALVAIAAVSLAVAGILIMNVMLVAVAQRRTEIGILKALGARRRDILRLFLLEAVMLAALGAGGGLAVGFAGAAFAARLYPAFPLAVPAWAPLAATAVALISGLVFGMLPARRAAALDPVAALARR